MRFLGRARFSRPRGQALMVVLLCCLGFVVGVVSLHAQAPATASQADRITALEKQVADAQMAGDNGWMLVSARWC